MSKEKEISARIINKHDTRINWDKAKNFTPKKGELIIYDGDSARGDLVPQLKIGDGVTQVNTLPFFQGKKGDTGKSGVYVGSGEIPPDQQIRIDPEGEALVLPDVLQETGYSTTDTMSQAAITKAIKGQIPVTAIQPLTFTGNQDIIYDGSRPITVDIPFGGEGGGSSDYTRLNNKPQINGVELSGNTTLNQLGIKQDFAKINQIPTKVSQLANDKNYATMTDLDTKQPKGNYAQKNEIPNVLPNPHPLTINGVNSQPIVYDGSSSVSIKPHGGLIKYYMGVGSAAAQTKSLNSYGDTNPGNAEEILQNELVMIVLQAGNTATPLQLQAPNGTIYTLYGPGNLITQIQSYQPILAFANGSYLFWLNISAAPSGRAVQNYSAPDLLNIFPPLPSLERGEGGSF